MKKLLIIIGFVFLISTVFSKNWIVINNGFAFSPVALTINLGDTVTFELASSHNALEVSQTTWDANANNPITGFTTPLGGTMILPEQLTLGTHYYICEFHAAIGMKGSITVEDATGIEIKNAKTSFSVYPNPSDGLFHFSFVGTTNASEFIKLVVLDMLGQKVLEMNYISSSIYQFNLSGYPKGVYFVRVHSKKSSFDQKIVVQ